MVLEDLLEVDRVIELDDLRALAREGTNRLVERRSHGRLGPAIEEAAQPAEPRWARRRVRRSSLDFLRDPRFHRIASNKSRRSSTVRAIGPTWSRLGANGESPCKSYIEIILVGFIPATPQNDAGRVIEPPVWVPIAP